MASGIFPRTFKIPEYLVVFLGYLVFISLLGPWWSVYQLDGDEGINLQKAALVAEGHKLYTGIWSDQPPVLTYVLAAVQKFFPFSVVAARSTILLFAALLITCLYRLILRFEGKTCARIVVLILVSCSLFLNLSTSVMIGLPAVALTVLSLDLASTNRGDNLIPRMLAAGIVFSLAMLTKFFVLVALPSLLLAAWLSGCRSISNRGPIFSGLQSSFILLFALLATSLVIFLSANMNHLEQLLTPHLSAVDAKGFGRKGFSLVILNLREAAAITLYLGIPGILIALYHQKLQRWVPLCWLAIGFISLSNHRPLWDHHVLLLLIPLAWLGAIALGCLLNHGTRKAILFSLIAAVLVFVPYGAKYNWGRTIKLFNELTLHAELIPLSQVNLHKNQAPNIITDRPLDAFRAGLLLPPELAVWSYKRVRTGNINNETILKLILAEPDTQVSLGRFEHDPTLINDIAEALPLRRKNFYGGYEMVSYHFSPVENPIPIPESHTVAGTRSEISKAHISNQLLGILTTLPVNGLGGTWQDNSERTIIGAGEESARSEGDIYTKPPGSAQELGSCMLEAWKRTGQEVFLLEAKNVAYNLSCAQTSGGGWLAQSSIRGLPCKRRTPLEVENFDATYHDNVIVSVLYFGESLRDEISALGETPPRWLSRMIGRGRNFLLRSQSFTGYWPMPTLATEPRSVSELAGFVRYIANLYQRREELQYLQSALRAGHYLLELQGPLDQPAFPARYVIENLTSRPARPLTTYSLQATADAVNALVDLFSISGEESYRDAASRSARWLLANKDIPGPSTTENLARHAEINRAIKRTTLMQEDLVALADYDQGYKNVALLPDAGRARTLLAQSPEAEKMQVPQSTRDAVEQCAALLAKLPAKPVPQSSW